MSIHKTSYFLQKHKDWLIMLLAMILPIIVILIYPIYFQPDDMQDFLRWSEAWKLGWKDIYLNCSGCTYPILGTFFSGGIISFIEFEKIRYIVRAFHIYLALIDALNVVLIYFILKKLEVKNSSLWAGVIGLLPSSWIGTSYWGQIDGIGQGLILTLILSTIIFNQKSDMSLKKYTLFLIASGILLSFILLTKQLVLFSLLSLGAMTLTNILLRSRGLISILMAVLLFLFSFALPIVIADTILGIPAPYISHVQYILEIGSRIGNVISSFGFNAWIFFYEDTLVSSHASLIHLERFPNIEISPFTIGIFLFLLSNLMLFIPIGRYFYRLYKSEIYFFGKPDILLWLFQLGFLNLSFNIFLTGTHERYLYHFYPFIIMAFLGANAENRNPIYILLTGAFFYGTFLYGYLSALNLLFDKLPFYAMSIFHTCLLIYLGTLLNKYFLIHLIKNTTLVISQEVAK